MSETKPVLEMRVALTSADFLRSVDFYCKGLGIEPSARWDNGQGQALVLDLGHATLELFDEAQAETVDRIEVGERISGQVRFAMQVPDLDSAVERLVAHGATLLHLPILTPWGDRNARLKDPDGMHITLFQRGNLKPED